MRQLTAIDHMMTGFDTALRAVFVPIQRQSQRVNPAFHVEAAPLDVQQKRQVAGLMRVNHAGEVCAQALYQGQACTALLPKVKAQMEQAASEEVDHLAWCEQRLSELGATTSVLNGIWYMGSFLIGAIAGLSGDRWSLGFVAETERQVAAHLQKHLTKLPMTDNKTRAILETMQADESQHAAMAVDAGAAALPFLIRQCMRGVSKLMTFSSYYI